MPATGMRVMWCSLTENDGRECRRFWRAPHDGEATTQHCLSASTADARRIGDVDDQRSDVRSVEAGYAHTTVASWLQRSVMKPIRPEARAAPAMIGDTATASRRAPARPQSATTARIGPIDTMGFEGHHDDPLG